MKKHGLSKLTALFLAVCLLTTAALAAGGEKNVKPLFFAEPKFEPGAGFSPDPEAKPEHLPVMTKNRMGENSFTFVTWYIGENPDQVATGPMVSSNSSVAVAVQHQEMGEVVEGVYDLFCKSVGTTTLSCTKDGTTYTQVVEVVLPSPGFYSEQRFAEECCEPDICYDSAKKKTIYYLSQNGFSKEEADKMTVEFDEGCQGTWKPVRRSGDRYDLEITLPAGQNLEQKGFWVKQGDKWLTYGSIVHAEHSLQSQQATIGNYTVGYSNPVVDETNPFDLIEPGMRIIRRGSADQAGYTPHCELKIAAGIKTEDEDGFYYEEDLAGKVGIKVNRIWLDEFTGVPGTFSLSEQKQMHETVNPGRVFTVYSQMRENCAALVKADLTLTLGEETKNVMISQIVTVHIVNEVNLNRPDDDTVEKLNEDLKNWAIVPNEKTSYYINLGNCTYDGTIVLPEKLRPAGFEPNICISGSAEGETTLNGSLNLNGCVVSELKNVRFDGGTKQEKGLYGGRALQVTDCVFRNYELAMEMKQGSGSMSGGNLFQNNKVAVQMDLEENQGGNRAPWEDCTFVGNDIAIQIENLSHWLSPYHFRIQRCNFIDNGVDFDVDEDGNFYFYRNFYGTVQEDTLNKAAARIQKDQDGFIMTNPRWEHPLFERQHPLVWAKRPANAPENKLVCDWEDGTVILNDEAEDLMIDASAFDAQNQKTVDVFNKEEQSIGTWNFK